MKAILDSSFIIACMRKRIDFLNELESQGFRVSVPREVVQEIKDFKFEDSSSIEDKVIVERMLELMAGKYLEKEPIGRQKIEDWFIQKGKEGFYIGTRKTRIKNIVPKSLDILDSGKIAVSD